MRVRINKYELESEKINSNKNILVISDIHSNTKYLKKIIKYINKIDIDYIFIPGDLLDFRDSLNKDELVDILNDLSNNKKIIISMGNHDSLIIDKGNYLYDIHCNNDFYDKLNRNIIVLKEEFECIKVDEINVSALNINPVWFKNKEEKQEFQRFIDSLNIDINKEEFNIMLSHSPNGFIDNNKIINYKNIENVDLILSGHNHGGLTPNIIQKISKKHYGLVGPYYGFIKKDSYGYYKKNNKVLLISNGVTKISKCSKLHKIIFFLNMFFIPDIEIISIKKGDKFNFKLISKKIKRML